MNHLEPSWRDHLDRPTDAPPVPGPHEEPFYLPIGDFQGPSYRRNAFAAGTAEEVEVLRRLLDLRAGDHVLDVGCGDGRHLRALAADGIRGTGVDISPALLDAGRQLAREAGLDIDLEVGDARDLPAVLGGRAGTFAVAWSLSQGALGTSPATDPAVLAGLGAAVRPGGRVAVTFFHALFAARHLVPGDAFDPVHLVHHQTSEVRGPDDRRRTFDLWTASYTVREALRAVTEAGLQPLSFRGVQPGAFGRRADGEVGLDDPEVLVVARRPP